MSHKHAAEQTHFYNRHKLFMTVLLYSGLRTSYDGMIAVSDTEVRQRSFDFVSFLLAQ